MQLQLVDLSDSRHWDSIVSGFQGASAYHLAGYHKAASQGETALLFTFYQKPDADHPIAAIPLLLQPILKTEYYDLNSVYGYPGWLFSEEVTTNTIVEITEQFMYYCQEHQIVSVFSRLHPFTNYQPLSNSETGNVRSINPIVWIDTTSYPQGRSLLLERSLRKAASKEVRIHSIGIEGLNDFRTLYYQTMKAKGAQPFYFFPLEYFEQLFLCKTIEPIFLTAFLNEKPIAAALFFHYRDIAYYHLGGTSSQHLGLSPMKSILDHSVQYYRSKSVNKILLGGGYNGSQQDGLLFFKNQFSKQLATFSGWQWITNPDIYQRLSKTKAESNYFPLYRSI